MVPMHGFRIRWQVLLPLIAMHMGALLAFYYITWDALLLTVVLWLVTGLFGITIGYHRLLTHRAFETYPWVRRFHALCAAPALQQGPLAWVRQHRAHHAYSDTEKDPHPQYLGFGFGHMGWSFLSHKTICRSKLAKLEPVDLKDDPVMRFLEQWHLPLVILSLVGLYLWGGLPYLLWAGCFRIVWVMHITWTVNSLGHRFGYRSYDTADKSTNNWLVAALAFGEGWHNNHHRFPDSARQGLLPWEIDLSWHWIRFLRFLGLAWNVREPEAVAISKTRFSNPVIGP